MHAKTFAIIISFIILFSVIELIRRQKMTFKYSMLWLIACALVFFFAINDAWLKQIATFFGFELLSNFIFFLFLVFSIFVCLLLTLYLNEQNNRNDALAQSVGMLEQKMSEILKSSPQNNSEKK